MIEPERAPTMVAVPPRPTQSFDAPERPERVRQRTRRTHAIRRVLLAVLGLNLLVAGLKIGYGLLSGSVAMSADGLQALLDGVANIVGLVGIAVAARPPDRDHPYGHERYETLASMAIAGLMTIGVVEIVQSGWGRLRAGNQPEVTWASFAIIAVTMAISVGVSLWERHEGQRLRSDLLGADAKHTATDVLAGAVVFCGLAGVQIGWRAADAVASFVIAAIIAWAAWTIVRDASLVLSDATLVDPQLILGTVLSAPGVVTAHNLRARSSGGRTWVEVHVTVAPDLRVKQAHEVATRVEQSIRATAGPRTEAIVHIEPAEPPHTRPDPLFGERPAPASPHT